jgi:hypothetical protein
VEAITNETEVALINEDGSVEWTGPFADFCASNRFEDDEIAEIEAGLQRDGEFVGGGGALAGFRLQASSR